ncbi:uroporphyrinogen-III synthase [Janibacter terrae]|uniref:uroporphyrinogen-III synthase n=1 Tax=Janibacter terrae TaxID=103817 RepID=UPI00082B074B|nr:uroporphyrinogen-III synthase [Janibacter terrae]
MSTPLPAVMAGRTVLITADRRSEDLADAFIRRGATIRHAAAISIVPHADDERLLDDTRALLADPPEIVVITTGQGLRGWIEAAEVAGLDADLLRVLDGARILARGPKAKGALIAQGLAPAWVAESETAAEIIEHLAGEDLTGTHVAVQHHGNGSDGIDAALAASGARVSPFVIYRWGPAPDPAAVTASAQAVAAGEIDTVVFTSAGAVEAWFAAADAVGATAEIVRRAADSVLFAAVGPVTAAPLRAKGVEPLVPERSRMGALVRAVLQHRSPGAGADGR